MLLKKSLLSLITLSLLMVGSVSCNSGIDSEQRSAIEKKLFPGNMPEYMQKCGMKLLTLQKKSDKDGNLVVDVLGKKAELEGMALFGQKMQESCTAYREMIDKMVPEKQRDKELTDKVLVVATLDKKTLKVSLKKQ